MKQEKIFSDSRVNRDANMGFYNRLCVEYANKAFGQWRAFGAGEMNHDYYTSTSWKGNRNDIQVTVFLDFNTNTIKVTAIK